MSILPIKPLLCLLIIVTVASCEGYRTADGIVKDAVSNMPLDSVLVKVETGTQEMLTDSTGTFDVHNRLGGCMFGCKDITVSFSKEGFVKKTVTNPEVDAVVFLER